MDVQGFLNPKTLAFFGFKGCSLGGWWSTAWLIQRVELFLFAKDETRLRILHNVSCKVERHLP